MKRALTVTMIIFVLTAAFCVFIIRKNNKSQDSNILVENRVCIIHVEDYILGKWIYPGGDYPTIPWFVFYDDNTFDFGGLQGEDYLIHGKWQLKNENNKPEIKLIFDSLDDFWTGTLDDPNLMDDFDGVVNYSLDEKQITFSIGYAEMEGVSECLEDRYYIDFINVYLYKTVE